MKVNNSTHLKKRYRAFWAMGNSRSGLPPFHVKGEQKRLRGIPNNYCSDRLLWEEDYDAS